MTGEQRARVRGEIDSRRRAALAAKQPPKPAVVRAAEKARRAQEAKPLMAAIVEERPRQRDRCIWCGDPSPKNDGVCVGHRDLGGLA